MLNYFACSTYSETYRVIQKKYRRLFVTTTNRLWP